jgi:hypothetical protein
LIFGNETQAHQKCAISQMPLLATSLHGNDQFRLGAARWLRSAERSRQGISRLEWSVAALSTRSRLTLMRAFETVHAEPDGSVDWPNYRVNFWQQSSLRTSWNLDAFVLIDAKSVTDALRWVDEHAHGRRFEVFAEVGQIATTPFETPRTSTLVRLLGSNPNAGEPEVMGAP